VEPVCAVLEFAPSTYWAAKKRELESSARAVRDEELKKGDHAGVGGAAPQGLRGPEGVDASQS
jgi:hypothetical protein